MVDILLITDQQRLENLFSFARASAGVILRVTRSLQHGQEEIASSTPGLLFIQNHLSGLSGEIVARHLLSAATGRKPWVVLFGDSADSAPDIPGALALHLDQTLSDTALEEKIQDLIAAWMVDNQQKCGIPAQDSLQTHNSGTAPAFDILAVSSSGETEALQKDDLQPTPLLPEEREEPAPDPAADSTPFQSALDACIEQSAPPVPASELLSEAQDATPLQGPAKSRRFEPAPAPKTSLSLLQGLLVALVSALIVAGIGGYLLSSKPAVKTVHAPLNLEPQQSTPAPSPLQKEPPAPLPAKPVQQPAPPAVQPPPAPSAATSRPLTALPSVVPRQGLDRKYNASHPGWERYLGARTEFKIYRDGTTIKAMQVIDRSGRGIPDAFFRATLQEVAGTRTYRVDKSDKERGYLIERAKPSETASLVVYRQQKHGAIKAFVVSFP